jgi:hypothetical protein
MSLIRQRLFVLVPTSVILWKISLMSLVIICIGSGLRSGLKAKCMKRYVSSLISLRTCPKKPCLIGSLLMLSSMLSFENRSPLPEDTGSSLLWTGCSKVQCGQDIRPIKTRWSLLSTTPESRTQSQNLLSRPFGNCIKTDDVKLDFIRLCKIGKTGSLFAVWRFFGALLGAVEHPVEPQRRSAAQDALEA